MTLKSYFSPTVEAAMAQAAKELGPDAMLVYSRESAPEARAWGRYEVVFGWEMNSKAPEQPPVVSAPTTPPPASTPTPGAPVITPERLAEFGFSQRVSNSIVALCKRHTGPQKPGSEFWKEVQTLIPVSGPGLEHKPTAILLAGPPGVGKTTTLAKLAYRLGCDVGRPLHLIATDGHRICGGQYLERLAQISRAVYSQIASLVELERLLRAEPPGRLVLTEASDWLTANPLTWAALRKRNPGLEVHLLMPVTHRLSDLRMLFARYRGLAPNRIIAARADESPQWGAVCSLAAEEQLPISYISHGEAIPDELEPASIEQLFEAPFRAEAPSPQNRPSRSRADRDDRKFALNSWGGAA